MMISVAIVEDAAGVRESLAMLVDGTDDCRCVGHYESVELFLSMLKDIEPDVVLMDINLPGGLSGIEGVRRLKITHPKTQVIMLTVYEETEKIFDALKAGASGYLLKRATTEEILAAIHEVKGGGSPMTPHIARKVVRSFQEVKPSTQVQETLTKREREVLQSLAVGFTYKEIADTLGISIETVRTYLRRIYKKLQVNTRTEAVGKYVSNDGTV
jgi:DNA-binding NarL/FixJ family response regulator